MNFSVEGILISYLSHTLFWAAFIIIAIVIKRHSKSLKDHWVEDNATSSILGLPRYLHSGKLLIFGITATIAFFLTLQIIGFPKVFSLVLGLTCGFGFSLYWQIRSYERRLFEFDSCLADALQTVVGSLEAGLTLKESLAASADSANPTFKEVVNQGLKEYRLGRSFEDVLESIRLRVPTKACNIAFGAMILGNQMGGCLAASLQGVAQVVREQRRVEGRLRALTAQGRSQAALLIAAAPLLGIGMYLYDPIKMKLLTDYWLGQILLGMAICSELAGIVVIKRMLRLEV